MWTTGLATPTVRFQTVSLIASGLNFESISKRATIMTQALISIISVRSSQFTFGRNVVRFDFPSPGLHFRCLLFIDSSNCPRAFRWLATVLEREAVPASSLEYVAPRS